MEPAAAEQLAAALWPLIASGAAQRVGERGADEVAGQIETLWQRIRGRRTQRGLDALPGSEHELQEELAALGRDDPDAERSMQVIVNHFHGTVNAQGANFGIRNR